MSSSDKAQILVWITCDGVHIDPGSGKHTLLGVFSNIFARQFPVQHPYMIWFLTLTNVTPGKHLLAVKMGPHLSDMKEIFRRDFESQNPSHRINLINELRGFVFDRPADYQIQIEVDDDVLLVTSMGVYGAQ